CPYGQCSVKNGLASCDCVQCLQEFADYTQEQDLICADNGYTYTRGSLKMHGERFILTILTFFSKTDQNPHYRICASNHHYYSNQCEMDVASCEQQTRLYVLDQRYCEEQLEYGSVQCNIRECEMYYGQCIDDVCTCPDCNNIIEREEMCATNRRTYNNRCLIEKESCEKKVKIEPQHLGPCLEEINYVMQNEACGTDEPSINLTTNYYIECNKGQCPLNSYCKLDTNICCVKVITALVPYKLCLNDSHCGTNMVCLSGICECKEQSYLPALKKRECFKQLQSIDLSCHHSLFGCCNDSLTSAPSYDRRGCPERCTCNPHGSSTSTCDPNNGVCYCKPAVGGSTCSNCENNYWGFSGLITNNNTGCIPCGCNPLGSIRQDCYQGNGSCACKPYTTGRKCDRCKEHDLTLTEHGCVDVTYLMTHQRSCREVQCKYDSVCQLELGRPVSTDDERPEPLNDDDYSTIEYHPTLIESKRCGSDYDCGENMVCLSDFCECADQKYRKSGSKCVRKRIHVVRIVIDVVFVFSQTTQVQYLLRKSFLSFNIKKFSIISSYLVNPVRRTIVGACTRRTPCENNSTCQDKPNGNYICLCGWQWQGRHCTERFEVTIPRFNSDSYFELKSFENIRQLRLDLIFESNRHDGLILYSGDAEKISEHFFMIALRSGHIDVTIRVDYWTEPIQISQQIPINKYIHLKMIISNGEIKIQINDESITSSFS
ncbi:unnamed protein product, partial [Didymodactylos carnosus]